MVHGFALAALILVVFAACGQIVNDLLSEQQHRNIKDWLEDWYVVVADDGRWELLVVGAAGNTEGVMTRWFGRAFWSWEYFLIVLLISWVALFLVSQHYYFALYGDTRHYEYNRAVFSAVTGLANALIDTLSLGVGRIVLRAIAGVKSKARAVAVSALFAAIGYASIVAGSVAFMGLLTLIYFYFGHVMLNTNTPEGSVYWFITDAFLWPHAVFSSPAALVVILPALSAIVFLAVLLLSTLLLLSRPLVQHPLSIALERLAEAPKGAVATVSRWIAIIAGIIIAAKDVFT
jgi:hypothetical protein